ncbi:hypothetical protein ACNFBR_09330 [Pseudomonas sp. NY11955]|uniref:hypothetical protein n=1 Tax=Pseudomonas sp. NY11955 TaxID=3400363 RepID=UPI003A893EA2
MRGVVTDDNPQARIQTYLILKSAHAMTIHVNEIMTSQAAITNLRRMQGGNALSSRGSNLLQRRANLGYATIPLAVQINNQRHLTDPPPHASFTLSKYGFLVSAEQTTS